jgi:hypothetical protein
MTGLEISFDENNFYDFLRITLRLRMNIASAFARIYKHDSNHGCH